MFCLQRVRTVAHPLLTNIPSNQNIQHTNQFWAWLTIIFNSKLSGIDKTFVRRVSETRVKQIGPDRACAEWLLRNGAIIRWKGMNEFVTNYNNLPKDDEQPAKPYYLHEVDATQASISHHGFAHFKNCKYVEGIKFDKCMYLEDEAIKQLEVLKNSLESLLIYNCGNITDEGLLAISRLLKLKTLKLANLIEVKDMKKCLKTLQTSLPNCLIQHIEHIDK